MLWSTDREDGSNDEGEERAPKLKRRPAANGEAAKAKKARRESEGGVAKPTGFTREHVVSPELAAWLDRKTVSRPDLTRFFWAYIKERGLQVGSGRVLAPRLQASAPAASHAARTCSAVTQKKAIAFLRAQWCSPKSQLCC